MSIHSKTLSPRDGAPSLRKGLRFDHSHKSAAEDPVAAALGRARDCLLSVQKADGHWCGELQGDTILESEYIMLMAFLGKEQDEKVVKAASYILTQERPEGRSE